MSIESWIRHEQNRRRINIFYGVLAAVVLLVVTFMSVNLVTAVLVSIVALAAIAMFAGLSNVCFLLGRPELNATDEQIRIAADNGPTWLRKLVHRLDQQ